MKMKKLTAGLLALMLLLLSAGVLFAEGPVKTEAAAEVREEEDGTLSYCVDGVPDPGFTGFFKYNGKKYYFTQGVCDTSYTGLIVYSEKRYYYLEKGALNKEYNSLARVKGEDTWYYVQDGKWNRKYTGPVEYKDNVYYVETGVWTKSVTGLYLVDGVYCRFKNGKLRKTFSGWYKTGGEKFYFEEGRAVTGWQKIDGAVYYMDKQGVMATETVKIDGRLEVFHTDGRFINTASMDKKAAKLKSKTNYLILVDVDKKVTKIYKGSKGNWKVKKNILCSVGDPSKGWDTVKGTFYVGYSSWGNPYTRGDSFDDAYGDTLYYWTRFCDDFLFHSQCYVQGTRILAKERNGLGEMVSHGCVRMRIGNAKWIYKHVPDGSKVVVY